MGKGSIALGELLHSVRRIPLILSQDGRLSGCLLPVKAHSESPNVKKSGQYRHIVAG